MSEALVAESLAGVSAVLMVAGVAVAVPRRTSAPSKAILTARTMWIACSAVVGAVLPVPKIIAVPAAVVLAMRMRVIVAARSHVSRRREMDAEIPQLLDLLAAGSAAGLSAVTCLERAVPVLRGPLRSELGVAVEEVGLGARWREELTAAAERSSLPDLRRAVSVLTRTERLGSSLSEATRELAEDVRRRRRAAVTERARAAPVKMLFPLVFLVLPAFLLLTVVPVLLTTVESIR